MSAPHYELPDHVRKIIDRDGPAQFKPPSFERWLGRLQITRTMVSMLAFLIVWFVAHEAGLDWGGATIRAIIAGLVFHFFAWASCLFIFGELYEIEVREARIKMEQRERDRAQRIEDYYRDRLRAKGLLPEELDGDTSAGGYVPSLDAVVAHHAKSPPAGAADMTMPMEQQRAA